MAVKPPNSNEPLDIQAIEDTAIEWIARLRAEDVTDAERADFAEWLVESPANTQAFDAMAELWGLTGGIEPQEAELPKPTSANPTKRWVPMALAASIMMAVTGFLLIDSGAQYRTERGEQRRVVLEDGSTVHLNTRSTVLVTYDNDNRIIELSDDGEAYFEVAKDPQRPFVVSTSYGNAEALGTAFNVHAMGGHTRVAVSEGSVAVSTGVGESTTLVASQEALLKDQELVLGNRTPANIAAWRTGRLVYDGVRLEALVADLNRYLPKPMSLADESLNDVTVSAVLKLQSQEAMLDAIAESLDLRWTIVSDNLILLHPH